MATPDPLGGVAGTPSLVPVPDPTSLTTEALERAMATVRREIKYQSKTCKARMDSMDHATDLRLDSILAIPDDTAKLIKALQDVIDEKFASIQLQFSERDVRTDQASRASKEALDAALLAAKELVGATNLANAAAAAKSEDNFTKQIEQISTLIISNQAAIDARITELKERIDRGGGIGEGVQGQRVEHRAAASGVYAAMGVVIAVVAVLVSVAIVILKP